MKKLFLLCSLLSLSFYASAIALPDSTIIPLTSQLLKKYNLSNSQLKKLQYWSGETNIVLTRKLKSRKSKVIAGGTLVIEHNQAYEKIVIAAHTPGVLKKIGTDGQLWIRFSKVKKRFLVFGQVPAPYQQEGNYILGQKKGMPGKTRYGRRKVYEIESGLATGLDINISEIKKNEKNIREEEGVRVKN